MPKYIITTTTHKTGILEQYRKTCDELEELSREIHNYDGETLEHFYKIIDEAIDVAKAALKTAENVCNYIRESLDDHIKKNDLKNEVRNYHD